LLKCDTVTVLFCCVSSLQNKGEKTVFSLLYQLHSQIVARSRDPGFTSREWSVVVREVLSPSRVSQEVTLLLQHLLCFLQSSFFNACGALYQLRTPPKPSSLLLLTVSVPILPFLSAFPLHMHPEGRLSRSACPADLPLHSSQTAAALASGRLAARLPEHGDCDCHSHQVCLQRPRARRTNKALWEFNF